MDDIDRHSLSYKFGKWMYWYFKVLKNYAVFDGRATRQEYWMFALFNITIQFTIALVLSLSGAVFGVGTVSVVWLVIGIYDLAVMIPTIAVAVRRVHDVGRSGLWIIIPNLLIVGLFLFAAFGLRSEIIATIFIIGFVICSAVSLVFMFIDSQSGKNKYGPNPKGTLASVKGESAATNNNSNFNTSTLTPQTVSDIHARLAESNLASSTCYEQNNAVLEDRLYAQIAQEVEASTVEKSLWTKAYAQAGGDETQTRVLYIKARFERLMAEEQSRLAAKHKEQEAATRQEEDARIRQNQERNRRENILFRGKAGEIEDLAASSEGKEFLAQTSWGDMKYITQRISDNPSFLAITTGGGDTALHLAVVTKRADVIKLLVDEGADIQILNKEGKTALDIAKATKQVEVVELLVAAAQDVNIKKLQHAAEQGDAMAQHSLAVHYIDGEIVQRDFEKAASWLRKSAMQGCADAQYLLGIMHEGGEGVEQDIQQATSYMRKAAEQGHTEAQAWLLSEKKTL